MENAPSRLTTRAGLAVLAAVSLLALVETASAIVAPYRAPTDADWRAAAGAIRAGFRPGDLIVAAPAWADPILRVHLGDLIPAEIAGRMDDERFQRVWEIGQRGATSAAAAGGTVADGELMLLHQGAAAFTLWTGQPAPLELMQAKLAEARAGGLRSAEGEPSGAPADGEPAADGELAAGSTDAAADIEPATASAPD